MDCLTWRPRVTTNMPEAKTKAAPNPMRINNLFMVYPPRDSRGDRRPGCRYSMRRGGTLFGFVARLKVSKVSKVSKVLGTLETSRPSRPGETQETCETLLPVVRHARALRLLDRHNHPRHQGHARQDARLHVFIDSLRIEPALLRDQGGEDRERVVADDEAGAALLQRLDACL